MTAADGEQRARLPCERWSKPSALPGRLLDHLLVGPHVDEVLDVLIFAEVAQRWAGKAVVCPQGEHERREGVPQLDNLPAYRCQRYLAHIDFARQQCVEEQDAVRCM